MQFLFSVENILSILLIVALGYVLQRRDFFTDDFNSNISKLILNVALPAGIFVSVLTYLTKDKLFSLSGGLIYGAIAFCINYGLAWLLMNVLKIPNGRKGIFINTEVNANTVFLGLPLTIAIFGQDSVPYFLVYYVLNTVSTWTIGAYLIANDPMERSADHLKNALHWKKLLPPPLLGLLAALVFLLLEIPVPKFIDVSLGYVGSLITPLSLIYIGIVIGQTGLKSIRLDKDTVAALSGRMIMAPMVFTLLIFFGSGLLPLPDLEAQTIIMQATVPALSVLPILAHEAKADVRYATNIVTTSTILFMITAPIVNELLELFYS